MRIAVTGGTGFIGRYLLRRLASSGYQLKAWHRESSDRSDLDDITNNLDWVLGSLGTSRDASALVEGCDAVVHAAFHRTGSGFRSAEGDLIPFCETNLIGSLQLIEEARKAGVKRFVFISSCAVHEKILKDRPLDETHPTWAGSHYGAYKAAVEQFIYSFGLGQNYPICGLRPTGVYGADHPIDESKWYSLVGQVVRGETVQCEGGGKEVHADDVAKAVDLLLETEEAKMRGQVFNCYDRYVSQHEVATLAKQISGANVEIGGQDAKPKNQIETGKIRALGMQFGGEERLQSTIKELVDAQRE